MPSRSDVKTAFSFLETTYSILGGLNSLDTPADIRQDPVNTELGLEDPRFPVEMAQANNVFAPTTRADLQTRPGFTEVRSTAINAAGIFTSFAHLGEIADEFLITVSIVGTSHNIYRDNANPPGAIAGGTNFTIGQDNLITPIIFSDGTTPMVIFVSRSKDLPQSVTGAVVRANFTIAGTGLTSLKPEIAEVFGQRALYGDYDQDGTVYDDRVAWSAIRDGNLITDITTDFLSFETRSKDRVRAIHKISDICMVGKLDNVFTMILTPNASKPFDIQEEAAGRYKGPVSNHAVIEADQKLFWMGQKNIHSLDTHFQIKDWADRIKPTIDGLADNRREFIVAGFDIDRDLAMFAVSGNGKTQHDQVIALNVKTGALYIWTITRNAFGYRLVSGDNRLIGGGYVGKFYQENNGALGNLDDASAAIDADIFTPRHHMNFPTWNKLFAGIKVTFDPQATSEAVTVQYRLNDASAWSDFEASPYTVTGTANDVDTKYFPLMKMGTHLQLRFRDSNASQTYRITKYAILWKFLNPALGH